MPGASLFAGLSDGGFLGKIEISKPLLKVSLETGRIDRDIVDIY